MKYVFAQIDVSQKTEQKLMHWELNEITDMLEGIFLKHLINENV